MRKTHQKPPTEFFKEPRKKTDKLKVSVTWKNDLWGKIATEKEIVLDDIMPMK
jgi:hypothetical protein